MKTIDVLTNTGDIITTNVVYQTEYYLVIEGFNSDYKYCVCLNQSPNYKAIARLNNKRFACRLVNYLSKTLNHKAILHGNRYYIVKIVKNIVINWLLDRKIYSSAVGNVRLRGYNNENT